MPVRALIQRVSEASVSVAGERVAAVGRGLLVLAAAGPGDGRPEAARLAAKIARLRVFADTAGKMNRSLLDVGGEALVVSQFTLYGDVSRGNRPSFVGAAAPEEAARALEALADGLRELGVAVGTGRFGADMQVALVNDGPVTIWLDGV
ncbi:MAG TPA: D-aminoacyl-tRNA deacylase [Gaiellales bacterium]|nr:D-aminoacyl-tRNA deacylase [Gaiellales bacterium]